ncbi:hypothetical protein RUM43_001190, partial [Polyplax serrata]
ASLHQRKCPHLGRYAIVGQSEGLEASGRTTRDVILAAKRVHRAKRDKNSLMEVEKVKDCDADKFESLNVGCLGGHDTMEFQSACGPDSDSGAVPETFTGFLNGCTGQKVPPYPPRHSLSPDTS